MSYQVIARKWRPQTFSELVGQAHISTTLLNALKNGRTPQALLFTGPRGTGKTSTARILAKSLRCPNAVDFVPCNTCPACEDVASGRSLDVIEIDGASNNGVDAVRELRETVGYMPSSGRYKVYIIDEVHMLSTSAFNALLKTLEEPPPHVVFILATTEVQKIPITILSRCQRFDFRRIGLRQIASHLEKICASEKIKFDPKALWLIARQGDGSMRDSQSLLDQVISFCDGHLSLANVVDVLGLTDRTLLVETLRALVTRDSTATVNAIEKILTAGYDPKNFAQDLLEEIRNALMVRVCPEQPDRIVDLPDSEIAELREMTTGLGDEELHLLFDMALKGTHDMLRALDTRLVLEMLLLRMAAAPRVQDLASLLHNAPIAEVRPVVPAATAKPFNAKPVARPSATTRPPLTTNPVAARPASPKAAPAEPLAPKPEVKTDPWARFVDRVKEVNGLLGAMLENTYMMQAQEGHLVIGVPKKLSFIFDKIQDIENIRRVENFIDTFWGKKYSVEVRLADEKGENSSPKAQAETQKQAAERAVEQKIENHPLVRSAQTILKTQIKSIKEST